MIRRVALTALVITSLAAGRAAALDESLAPADPHPKKTDFSPKPPPGAAICPQPPKPSQPPKTPPCPHHAHRKIALPPLVQILFGANKPDAVVKGKYYAVRPNGALGACLGSFRVEGDVFKMFPAGGGQIQVATNDAPKGGVLETDYAHYATPPIDPLVVTHKPNGMPVIGPEREHEPHGYLSRSSGTLKFFLGGPKLDAEMQQKWVTVFSDKSTGGTRTREQLEPPARIRFIPD
jgi:hypothetical protein